VVGCAAKISERYLVPVLEAIRKRPRNPSSQRAGMRCIVVS